MKCPKCEGEMEEGQLLAPGAGVRWAKGKMEGLAQLTGSILWGKPIISAYRCTDCGYLESYAK